MITALVIGLGVNLIVGFVFGKYHERIEWNKLIQKGLIPVPVKKK